MEFADFSPGCLDVARLRGSDQVLEFGENLLDRVAIVARAADAALAQRTLPPGPVSHSGILSRCSDPSPLST